MIFPGSTAGGRKTSKRRLQTYHEVALLSDAGKKTNYEFHSPAYGLELNRRGKFFSMTWDILFAVAFPQLCTSNPSSPKRWRRDAAAAGRVEDERAAEQVHTKEFGSTYNRSSYISSHGWIGRNPQQRLERWLRSSEIVTAETTVL